MIGILTQCADSPVWQRGSLRVASVRKAMGSTKLVRESGRLPGAATRWSTSWRVDGRWLQTGQLQICNRMSQCQELLMSHE